MIDNKIFDTYHDLSENDAFEVFGRHNVSHETIARVLGYDVATDYMVWIRRFNK